MLFSAYVFKPFILVNAGDKWNLASVVTNEWDSWRTWKGLQCIPIDPSCCIFLSDLFWQRHFLKEFYNPFWCIQSYQAFKAENTFLLNLSIFFPNIQPAHRIKSLFFPLQSEWKANNTHMILRFFASWYNCHKKTKVLLSMHTQKKNPIQWQLILKSIFC